MFVVTANGIVIGRFATRHMATEFARAVTQRTRVAAFVTWDEPQCPDAWDTRPGAFKDAA